MLKLVVPRWIYRILKQKGDAEGKSVASVIVETLIAVHGQDVQENK